MSDNSAERLARPFFTCVEQHFAYLHHDYGFVTVSRTTPGPHDVAVMTMQSPLWQIAVVREMSLVVIYLAPSRPASSEFGLSDVITFLEPALEEDAHAWFRRGLGQSEKDRESVKL